LHFPNSRRNPDLVSNRILPSSGKPGPVSAIANLLPGETGSQALERIGAEVLPKQTKRGRPAKLPRQLAAIVACRTEGMSDKEIAQALNISIFTIRKILQRARKEHHLSDLVDRMENRAVPQAVENLIEFLDDKDREFTMATLKGVGIFRNHSAQKTEQTNTNQNTLRVEIVMPDFNLTAAPPTAIGAITATPRRPALPVIDVEPSDG
jgi:transposase